MVQDRLHEERGGREPDRGCPLGAGLCSGSERSGARRPAAGDRYQQAGCRGVAAHGPMRLPAPSRFRATPIRVAARPNPDAPGASTFKARPSAGPCYLEIRTDRPDGLIEAPCSDLLCYLCASQHRFRRLKSHLPCRPSGTGWCGSTLAGLLHSARFERWPTLQPFELRDLRALDGDQLQPEVRHVTFADQTQALRDTTDNQ